MTGVSGSLVAADVLRALPLPSNPAIPRTVRSILARAFRTIGPASAARTILDVLVLPLAQTLGFNLLTCRDPASEIRATLHRGSTAAAQLAVGSWDADLERLTAATAAARTDLRWSIMVNGAVIRFSDRLRVYARRTLDVDLRWAAEDDDAAAVLVKLLEADERGCLATLERCTIESDAHRVAVGRSLQIGVEQALGHLIAGFAPRRKRGPAALDAALANALTIVYRILFLLFAEARGLVPQWHPIYRDSYTIESLRPAIERSHRPPGVWQALQAISRLAYRGCRAGTLRVTPFNGRLFAPAGAPLAESIAIDDRRIREALLAITTRPSGSRRERIAYADLGVEQLGAVYERVLDYCPVVQEDEVALARSGRRKATGTFYTPRFMTDYLVRRALAPLVRGRTADELLRLRVVDPAMGSGAFLVAACRYLAEAYEQALVRDGAIASSELTPSDRAELRRTVAQRCLYGVDRNPTAVQLARLSLWLYTLAADRPLTFFDHHLRAGNSLVGAAPRDIMRQPPGMRGRFRGELPLFDTADLHDRLAAAVAPRTTMATEPDDTAEIVRRKERTLAALDAHGAPLATWRSLADAWCAVWFWPRDSAPPAPRAWGAMSAALRGAPSGLPPALEESWLNVTATITGRERFFHWELEFPEVFFDSSGHPLADAGFDAVLGNPPWDTLRESPDAVSASSEPRAMTRFSRDSGCYRLQGDGHANLYQLFAERALQLVRPAGRLGLLLPSGLFADHGCARLRRELLERTRIDTLISFDNREGVFPIHRGVRFALVTTERGPATHEIATIAGLHAADALDDLPDEGALDGSVVVPLSLIRKFSGPDLAFPELPSDRDRGIVARIVSSAPPLGSEEGWHCRFGRELNATDDRRHFGERGLPVLEGKLIEPFRVNVSGAARRIDRSTASLLLGSRAAFDRPRLGYREVAASTNRLTLIAAIIPADAVTTHTIFCLKGIVGEDVHWFLCGLFNSFVANYLVRLRGGTHVTAAAMLYLPAPTIPRESTAFRRVVALSRDLSSPSPRPDSYAELQALVARLYGLGDREFAHVLETFPLVPRGVRNDAAAALNGLMDAV